MATKRTAENASMQDLLPSGEPITHFFYEYQGDRAVEPISLVESGIALWHEHIYTNESHDNSSLWQLAESLIQDREDTPTHSWVEWLRYRITMGAFVPAPWEMGKPYPYKGLLISAIYLQEARRLCAEGQENRAWHIIAMAYYYLGLNATPSTSQNTSRAAQIMHAGRTEKVRALVLGALDHIKKSGSADSIEGAKVEVIKLLHEKQDKIKDWLNEFDTLVSKKTKGKQKGKPNDVFDRIRNLLETWSLPSGPYPDIADAFSQFSKRKRKAATETNAARSTSEQVPIDESDCFLRLINVLEDGNTLTIKMSRAEET
jgi:hypothetical protein